MESNLTSQTTLEEITMKAMRIALCLAKALPIAALTLVALALAWRAGSALLFHLDEINWLAVMATSGGFIVVGIPPTEAAWNWAAGMAEDGLNEAIHLFRGTPTTVGGPSPI